MIGWQQILIYLGSGVAGILIGLLAYLLIKRIPSKSTPQPTPLSFPKKREGLTEEQIELGIGVRNGHSELIEAIPPPVARVAVKAPIPTVKSEILLEVEKNLSIATAQWIG
jgi:hypothetical protein